MHFSLLVLKGLIHLHYVITSATKRPRTFRGIHHMNISVEIDGRGERGTFDVCHGYVGPPLISLQTISNFARINTEDTFFYKELHKTFREDWMRYAGCAMNFHFFAKKVNFLIFSCNLICH